MSQGIDPTPLDRVCHRCRRGGRGGPPDYHSGGMEISRDAQLPVRPADDVVAGIMASIVARRGHVSDTVGTLQLDELIGEFDLNPASG